MPDHSPPTPNPPQLRRQVQRLRTAVYAQPDPRCSTTYNYVSLLQRFPMSRKLTIRIEDAVYASLYRFVGRGNISKFTENIARPALAQQTLEMHYREASQDGTREGEARAWDRGSMISQYNQDLRFRINVDEAKTR